jgi:FixJ family two-component response regulator
MSPDPVIYVVDDNDDHRDILTQSMKKAGYEVEAYASGVEFLRDSNLAEIGCLVLDNQMPDITGLEVQAELLEQGSRLPIIFISGWSGIPDAVAAVRDGALNFLQKPFSSDELRTKVDEAVNRCREEYDSSTLAREYEGLLNTLTKRERQVHDLVITGNTNQMITEKLAIKISTVEFHRANMMDKMGVTNFSELMEKAQSAGRSV